MHPILRLFKTQVIARYCIEWFEYIKLEENNVAKEKMIEIYIDLNPVQCWRHPF